MTPPTTVRRERNMDRDTLTVRQYLKDMGDIRATCSGTGETSYYPVLANLQDGRPINPDAGDLGLTAGWGHAGQGVVTMPGRGKMEETLNAQRSTLNSQGKKTDAEGNLKVESSTLKVERSLDGFLNASPLCRKVPEAVWDYTLGGYQVVKKWLSYREKDLLGRSLTREEVRHVTDTCRRIAALIGMQAELDGNYEAAKRLTTKPDNDAWECK